jgi:hypothetical protein
MIDRCCPLGFITATSFACGLLYLMVLLSQFTVR